VPIKLWEYTIETNAKKFERHLTSLKNTLKVTALGTQEFKMKDILNSEYDLKEAALKYKFALMPKVGFLPSCVDRALFFSSFFLLPSFKSIRNLVQPQPSFTGGDRAP
jgi:hypothetical protein